MRDIKLKNDGSGLVFEGGDLKVIEDDEVTAQRIRVRTNIQEGEYEFDVDLGTDFKGDILIKNPNLKTLATKLRKQALSVPRVERVEDLSVSRDNRESKLNFGYTAYTPTGRIETTIDIQTGGTWVTTNVIPAGATMGE